MTDTLPFTLVQSLLQRVANRDNRDLPDLSLALSELDYMMVWHVKDKNNNIVAHVNGDTVRWSDE